MLIRRRQSLSIVDAVISIAASAFAGSLAMALIGCFTNSKSASDIPLIFLFFFAMSFAFSAAVGLTVGLAYALFTIKLFKLVKWNGWIPVVAFVALPFVVVPWAIYADSFSNVTGVGKSLAVGSTVYFASTLAGLVFVDHRECRE